MPRIVAALALLAGLSLAAALVSGFVGPIGRHRGLGGLALVAAAVAHGASALALAWSGWRIAARSGRSGLTTWVEARSERNRGKARACQVLGVGLIGLAAWSGLTWPGGWHRAVAALALGFQPGALLVGALMVAAQGRLGREVGGRGGEA